MEYPEELSKDFSGRIVSAGLPGGVMHRRRDMEVPMKVPLLSEYRDGSTYGEAWRGDESPLQIQAQRGALIVPRPRRSHGLQNKLNDFHGSLSLIRGDGWYQNSPRSVPTTRSSPAMLCPGRNESTSGNAALIPLQVGSYDGPPRRGLIQSTRYALR